MPPPSASLPRLFVWASKPRSLWILAAITLLTGTAMLPAIITMAAHGASLAAFEGAGTVARSQQIVSSWGDPGKTSAWWQLAFDAPFLVSYGLFIAGACAAVARRAEKVGKPGLRHAAILLAWCGPLAAVADSFQNISLALILSGHVMQPWPRISAICATAIWVLAGSGLAFALGGTVVTRTGQSRRVPAAPGGAG